MKSKKALFAGLCAAALMPQFAQAEGVVNLYIWSGYIDPAAVKQFEEKTGIKVRIDNYDSEETLLAKLKQGGGGYDVAVASQAMVPVLQREQLIQKVAVRDLPGYNKIIPKLRKPEWDPTGDYSVPYLWGTTNFAVDTSVYNGPTDSLKVLFTPPPQLRGKVNMLGSASDSVSLASIAAGVPLCSEDPKQMKKVQDLLMQQKPYVRTYNSKAGAIRESMVSGEIAVSSIWNGTAQRAREMKKSIRYVFPKEGSLAWVDNLVVPAGAPNPDNAKRLLAFLMQPDVAAKNSTFLKYQNPIQGSEKFLSQEIRDMPELNPPASAKMVFLKACSEKAVRMRDLIWTSLLK
ncbi:extracellular solute-binding protein [Vogesella sp. LIG4]|uniref:extracellular solute-binding protein n=1 Tax=Vogesella sp. LIG4 TaxID=1192162 RepID=UPI00081FF466|nr:extracellular solute-binding protein [Vogesella sp. LIG4]SCK24376.1 spermidine/putrescine transport system substrate-binding protein [Vogesella sp. LIG4]